MSGQDRNKSPPPRLGTGFFNSLIGTLRRSGSSRPEPAPEPEDLGLKTLRQVIILVKGVVRVWSARLRERGYGVGVKPSLWNYSQ